MLINNKINFGNTKNIFVASVILVAGIGGLNITVGSITITYTAVAMILGIVLNLVLKEKAADKPVQFEE